MCITGGVWGKCVVHSVLAVFFGINHLFPTDLLSLLPLNLVAMFSFFVR